MEYSVDVKIKKTLMFHFSFYLIKAISFLGFIKNEADLAKCINRFILNKRTFKYNVNGGKWIALDMSDRYVVVEEVRK